MWQAIRPVHSARAIQWAIRPGPFSGPFGPGHLSRSAPTRRGRAFPPRLPKDLAKRWIRWRLSTGLGLEAGGAMFFPVDEELQALIGEQQRRLLDRCPAGPVHLTPCQWRHICSMTLGTGSTTMSY